MSDYCFVDTNILVYFRDSSELGKQQVAADWLSLIWEKQIGCLSIQVLNEYYVTVTQKLNPGLDPESARLDVKNLMSWNPLTVNKYLMELGWTIQDRYKFSWWDSLIVAAAKKTNCTWLISEDFQHQQKIDNLTFINPFVSQLDQFVK